MKRWIFLVLAVAMLAACLASCSQDMTGGASTAPSSSGSSKVPSDKAASSGALSSDSETDPDSSGSASSGADTSSAGTSATVPTSSTASSGSGNGTTASSPASVTAPSLNTSSVTPSVSVKEFLNIDAAVAAKGLSTGQDVSSCFTSGAKGYLINGGPYKVNAEVLERLTKTPVAGNGSVIWKDYKKMGTNTGNTDLFDGVVPVSKLHDPVFMSCALPSDLLTYMSYRVNATNMYPADAKYRKLVAIGAVYKEKDAVIPDDAEITVCIGKIQLLINTGTSWTVGNAMAHPNNPMIYYLPWSLEGKVSTVKLANSSFMTTYSDHIEIRLKGSMLNGTYNVPDAYKDQVEGSVLHFWGTNWQGDGGSVKGCAAGYVAWIKEPEYVGKVVAAIGADWRTAESKVSQAFSGRNYKLTTEPRLIFGHNVGPKAYDTVMDTETVQRLFGLK